VRAVNVSISHDDDAVIAQLVCIKIVTTNSATQRRDQRANLGGLQHFVKARFFDVKNFSFQRQDGLCAPVTALFRGTAGRVTLDQKQL